MGVVEDATPSCPGSVPFAVWMPPVESFLACLLVCSGGDDAVAATPLPPATTRLSTAPKAQGAQPHSPRPLSVGVAAALAMPAPLCDRPPNSESLWVASIKSPSPLSSVARARPLLNCTNRSGNRRTCLWRVAISELAPPRLPPAPSQQPTDRQPHLSPSWESEPALPQNIRQCRLRCLAQGPYPSRNMTSRHTGAAFGIPLVSQIRGERLSWGRSAKGARARR